MVTNEQAKEAMATIKAFCNERYKEDDHGNVMCVGCHFFRGEYCRLTWDDEYLPKQWS